MKIIRFALSLSISLLVQWLASQTNAMSPLKIGDAAPDYVFDKMLNYESAEAKISDFRGKLLLLDVWAPWCPTCIMSFPKMEHLQKQFGDKIQVLLVGDDGYPEGRIPSYVDGKKGTDMEVKLPVPVIKKDDVFRKIFDWTGGLPHIVWIDPLGKIIAITNSYEVDSARIQQALDHHQVSLPVKVPKFRINDTLNFLLNRNPRFPGGAVYGSSFSPFNSKITGSAIQFAYDSSSCRVYSINTALVELYLYSFSKSDQLPFVHAANVEKRVLIESEELSRFKNPYVGNKDVNSWEDPQFQEDNCLNYELNLPPLKYSEKEVFKYMRADLDRFFRISSGIERRKIKCLALVRTSTKDKLKTTLNKDQAQEWTSDYEKISMKGYNMWNVLHQLNAHVNTSLVILDETGYKGKVDITMPFSADLNYFQQLLKKYDLKLKQVERELDLLVLRSSQ